MISSLTLDDALSYQDDPDQFNDLARSDYWDIYERLCQEIEDLQRMVDAS